MSTLLAYARMAETHWRQHCPRLVRQLQATGRLEAALQEAQERVAAAAMFARNLRGALRQTEGRES